MLNNIRNSFIKRMFLILTAFLLLLFVSIYIFQQVIFKQYYTNQVISDTSSVLQTAFTDDDITVSDEIYEISQTTQTSVSLVKKQAISAFTNFNLMNLTVDFEGKTYNLIVPNNRMTINSEGSSITGSFVLHTPSDKYVPLSLEIDGMRVLHSRMGKLTPIYTELLEELDFDTQVTINSTIKTADFYITPNVNQLSPTVSNEILNLITENYDEIKKVDSGYYFISSNQDESYQNIVFVSEKNIDNVEYLLFAIYPMSHIDDVVDSSSLINLYVFVFIFITLILFSLFYSKAFRDPLAKLNSQTNQISQLNFENSRLDLNRTDEFGELSKNINIMSANLKHALDTLQVQNQQLSKSISLENENEEKRKLFIRSMSHELKTPLAIIQASSEAIETGVYKDTKEISNALQTIQQEVKTTNSMINDMMNIYKLDIANYKENWNPIEIQPLISEAINDLQPLVDTKSIRFHSNIDPITLLCDPDKIKTIVSNLIVNAIKHTPKNGTINLVLTQEKGEVIFRIENSPAFIPPELIETIFDPFVKGYENSKREEENHGLGLYIVQETLKQYSSKCYVTSKDNTVTFEFTIKNNPTKFHS